LTINGHLPASYKSWLSIGGRSLDAARAGSCQRFAREKYGEAFSGNNVAYKYQVNMQI
jgi:hypothetical protein